MTSHYLNQWWLPPFIQCIHDIIYIWKTFHNAPSNAKDSNGIQTSDSRVSFQPLGHFCVANWKGVWMTSDKITVVWYCTRFTFWIDMSMKVAIKMKLAQYSQISFFIHNVICVLGFALSQAGWCRLTRSCSSVGCTHFVWLLPAFWLSFWCFASLASTSTSQYSALPWSYAGNNLSPNTTNWFPVTLRMLLQFTKDGEQLDDISYGQRYEWIKETLISLI